MFDVKSLAPRRTERGNTAVIVLVVLVVAAVGAVAFLSGKIPMPGAEKTDVAAAQPAAGAQSTEAPTQTADAGQNQTQTAEQEPLPEIRKGNPVVAKVGGKDLTRVDVFNYIQQLAPQTRQNVPPTQLFPLALNQVVNARLIEEKASNVNLDDDPLVKEQLAAAKKQIVQQAFVQKEILKEMTDERLKAAYDQYVANFPEVQEIQASHILVKEEAEANEIIKQLKSGADFAALAEQKSLDATKDNGGLLGYISKQDQIIPEYLEAAFAMKPGEVSAKPVGTETGYYVIKVGEGRVRPPAPFDDNTKAFLASQLTNHVLAEIIQKWRMEADVSIYDINGDEIEPAAGAQEVPAAPAEKEKKEVPPTPEAIAATGN